MKRWEKALFLALVICGYFAAGQASFAETCEGLRADTLRLHIVANSDSPQDQAVKLEVRDAVVELMAEASRGARGRDGLLAVAAAETAAVCRAADEILAENGFAYTAGAKITEMYFDQRSYGGVTLPAGEYTALRIELGKAEGKNWWCVLYPTVCLGGASQTELEGYDEEEKDVALGEDKYVVRFRIEEWLQELRANR